MDGNVRPFCPWSKNGRDFRPISENGKLDGKNGRASRSTFRWTHSRPHSEIHTNSQLLKMSLLRSSLVVSRPGRQNYQYEFTESYCGPIWALAGKMLKMIFFRPVWPYLGVEVVIDPVTGFFSQQCRAATPRTNWTEMFREAGGYDKVNTSSSTNEEN